MNRKTISSKPASNGKRVGASVVVDGQTPVGTNPFGQVANAPFNGGFGFPQVPGFGIPNPCGSCPPPFFPPLPVAPFPGNPGFIIDDRIEPPFEDDEFNTTITAGVAPQTIPANSTAVLLLASALSSTGGARVSGSSIILPIPGTYSLSINVTAGRTPGSTGGNISFILNGGVSGTGVIASGDVIMSGTQVFSGTISVRTNAPNTAISILVNNVGGVLQILGGTVTAQLVSGRFRDQNNPFF